MRKYVYSANYIGAYYEEGLTKLKYLLSKPLKRSIIHATIRTTTVTCIIQLLTRGMLAASFSSARQSRVVLVSI